MGSFQSPHANRARRGALSMVCLCCLCDLSKSPNHGRELLNGSVYLVDGIKSNNPTQQKGSTRPVCG